MWNFAQQVTRAARAPRWDVRTETFQCLQDPALQCQQGRPSASDLALRQEEELGFSAWREPVPGGSNWEGTNEGYAVIGALQRGPKG